MLAVSRWISGLSPGHPRRPPVCSISGSSPSCSVIDRERVVDDDRLVGAEVVDAERRRLALVVRRAAVSIADDAVLDVEVGLLLAAVAEHAQLPGSR